ncbi:hypothetical protein DFH07DRAFT_794744 [Mycena maculata]|uniref:Uncharacterized protein n=1 Tax=Mycena maculata TaxID=230809 RepID=A0AAD7NXS5_9AGAR|nr:hypothetical protein DFH07DRAFT_794744 [Mycena maculata]
MGIGRLAGFAFASCFFCLQTSNALTFGTLGPQIAVGETTEITWTSESTDPLLWLLSVTDHNGNPLTSVGTVDGPAEKFTFVFPPVESDFRPIFALQATNGNQVLDTSAPFRVLQSNQAAAMSSAPADVAASSTAPSASPSAPPTQPSQSIPPTPAPQTSPPIPSPTSSPTAPPSPADSAAPATKNIYALIFGPIIAVVFVGVLGFLLVTVCGCRGPRAGKSVEP